MKKSTPEKRSYRQNRKGKRLLKKIVKNTNSQQMDIREFQSQLDKLSKTVLNKKQKSKLLSKTWKASNSQLKR